MRPLGNQSPPKHVIWRKKVSIRAKLWSLEAGKKFYEKKKITAFDLNISPLCRVGPVGLIFTIFGTWCHIADLITHVKY